MHATRLARLADVGAVAAQENHLTRIRPISVATGPVVTSLLAVRHRLVKSLLAVRHRLWWLGVPVVASALAAGLLATAPAASAAQSVAGVTLAQVGNYFLFAGEGPANSGRVVYQTVGTSSSTGYSVAGAAPSGTMYSRPSITALTIRQGLRTVTIIGMVAEGPNNTLNFWWQPLAEIGSGPWHQEVLGGPGTQIGTPSIVQIGNDVAVAAEGTNHSLNFFWQQIGASGWNTLLNQEEGLVYTAPTMAALTSAPNTLGIAWTYPSGYVDYAQMTLNSGNGWQLSSVGYSGATGGPWVSTITELDNGVTAVTTQGADGSIDSWTTSDPPGNFSLTTDQAFIGTVYYANVSVAQLGGGVVAAASHGVDDSLNFYWRLNSGGPWNREELGYIWNDESDPQVIPLVNSAGTQLVAVGGEASDYSVYIFWQVVGSSTWQTQYFPPGWLDG